MKPNSLAGCPARARLAPRLRDGLQPPRNRTKPHVGTVLPTQVTSDFNVGKDARQPTDQPKSPAPRYATPPQPPRLLHGLGVHAAHRERVKVASTFDGSTRVTEAPIAGAGGISGSCS